MMDHVLRLLLRWLMLVNVGDDDDDNPQNKPGTQIDR